MLYQAYEFNRSLFRPFNLMGEALQALYSNPFLPVSYTGFGRAIAAAGELMERTTRRYGKPAFGLDSTSIDGREVAVSLEVVEAKPFCELLHFARHTPRHDPKVLVVAPMSGHFATLLRDTVRSLLPDHDVYITDWVDAREVPLTQGGFGLDDYIDYVRDFIGLLGPDVHVLAVCQPSVPVLAAVSLMAEADEPHQARSMTLMGGPIDTRKNPTKVNELATTKPLSWFERTVVQNVPAPYPGFMRPVYPGFIQLSGFMSLNLDRHVDAHLNLFHHLMRGDGDSAESHRKFYDEYLSVMDLPAEFYLETIHTVFQDHALPRGVMHYRGDVPVRPEAISKVALMTVEGEKDDITGPGQTFAAHDICVNIPAEKRRHHLQPKVGHYGVFNGRRWREEVLPRVREFIRANG